MGERKIALDFRSLPEGMRQCGKCRAIKHMSEFYKDSRRASGVQSKCKDCTNVYLKSRRENPEIDHLSTRRKWASENKAKLASYNYAWAEANRDKRNLNESNRRARKKELPDNYTTDDFDELLYVFDGKCAISGQPFEHLDHFIPLATGRGGTIVGNMIPLCATLNQSKKDKNPLVWRNILTEEQQKRFDFVMEYLATENNMTVEKYAAYITECFVEDN